MTISSFQGERIDSFRTRPSFHQRLGGGHPTNRIERRLPLVDFGAKVLEDGEIGADKESIL